MTASMVSDSRKREEVEDMGRLWDIVQAHIDAQPYGASNRSVAARLGISPTALGNWRNPKKLPDAENLHALANLTGTSYLRVLDAALEDTGYHQRVGGEHARSAPMNQAGQPATDDDSEIAAGAVGAESLAPPDSETRPQGIRRTPLPKKRSKGRTGSAGRGSDTSGTGQ